VFEFRLWAALTEQSRGQLHVFLPLADRGVDALIHRLTDGAYLEVQAKSRSTLIDGEVRLVILADSLVHDELLIVAGQLVDGGLGPMVLVIPVLDFKRLAYLSTDQGKPIYAAEFGMRPRPNSKWFPWLVPADRIVERPRALALDPPCHRRVVQESLPFGLQGEQLAIDAQVEELLPPGRVPALPKRIGLHHLRRAADVRLFDAAVGDDRDRAYWRGSSRPFGASGAEGQECQERGENWRAFFHWALSLCGGPSSAAPLPH